MKRAYEVRCCCQPTKLLGVIVLDLGLRDPGEQHTMDFPINQRRQPIALREYIGQASEDVCIVRLPFAKFVPDYNDDFPHRREVYYALKAEGVSIETLRKIPGFIEIP